MKKRIVRFEIQDLLPIGLTLVVAGIGIVYGISVMGDVRSDTCQNTYYKGACVNCDAIGGTTFSLNTTTGVCYNTTNVSAAGGTKAITIVQSSEFNASTDAIKGIAKIPEKMPLIATVIVAAVIIGILVRYLMVRFT